MSDFYGMSETLGQLETELGQIMTLANDPTEYPCIVGARTDSHDLGMGGFANDATVEIVLRRELFDDTTLPNKLDTVYLNGKAHQIDTVVLSPDGAAVILNCGDLNKDA
jgi:hypothetical protein